MASGPVQCVRTAVCSADAGPRGRWIHGPPLFGIVDDMRLRYASAPALAAALVGLTGGVGAALVTFPAILLIAFGWCLLTAPALLRFANAR